MITKFKKTPLTKQVRVTDNIYDFLQSRKVHDREPFNDVLERLLFKEEK